MLLTSIQKSRKKSFTKHLLLSEAFISRDGCRYFHSWQAGWKPSRTYHVDHGTVWKRWLMEIQSKKQYLVDQEGKKREVARQLVEHLQQAFWAKPYNSPNRLKRNLNQKVQENLNQIKKLFHQCIEIIRSVEPNTAAENKSHLTRQYQNHLV